MIIFCSAGMFWEMYQTKQKEQLPDYYVKVLIFRRRKALHMRVWW